MRSRVDVVGYFYSDLHALLPPWHCGSLRSLVPSPAPAPTGRGAHEVLPLSDRGLRSSRNPTSLVVRRPPHTTGIAGPRGSGQESRVHPEASSGRTRHRTTLRAVRPRIRASLMRRCPRLRPSGSVWPEAFLPTPALPPGRKIRSLAGPTLFDPPATLRAETETFCSPGNARGVGLVGEIRRRWLIRRPRSPCAFAYGSRRAE